MTKYRQKNISLKIIVIISLMISACTPQEHCGKSASQEILTAKLSAFASKLKSEKAKKILIEASEDFDLVVDGKSPKNAKAESSLLNGTTKFIGNGYTINVVDTDGTVAGEYVNIYGPIIEFNDSEFQILEKKISDVRFYEHDKYQRLKGTR